MQQGAVINGPAGEDSFLAERQRETDTQRRAMALQAAMTSLGSGATTEALITRAETFLTFLAAGDP
jgi:hypothetical protein